MNEEIQTKPRAEEAPAPAAPIAAQTAPAQQVAPEVAAPAPVMPETAAPASATPKSAARKTPGTKAATPAPAAAKRPRKPAATTKTKPLQEVAAVELAAPVEVPQPAQTVKSAKVKKPAPVKHKLIRDSFTLPEQDYLLFATLKKRALASGVEVRKSELLRAGLAMLARAEDADFLKAIGLVERIKTGRPKK